MKTGNIEMLISVLTKPPELRKRFGGLSGASLHRAVDPASSYPGYRIFNNITFLLFKNTKEGAEGEVRYFEN